MKVIIIGASPRSIVNFRGKLINELLKSKCKVTALANNASNEESAKIKALGVNYIDYPISRNGLNPLEDIKTFMFLKRLFEQEKPDIVLAYTIKPVIWGGLAARFAKVPNYYSLITGLGFAFQKGGVKRTLLTMAVKFLYKQAINKSSGVIFQNPDNRATFIENKLIKKTNTYLINGSGVDIAYFDIKPLPTTPTFLLIARLLGDKGIREYIEAASIVKQQYPDALFQLVGPEDPSPDGITLKELSKLNKEDSVDYLGATKDVRPYIEGCNIFALPSYHEGLPRTVLEAMATGRPILTTDVPGCRETVINGSNGWLVEKANVKQLAERMIWFIENPKEWQRMAEASRTMVEDKFDVHKVNKKLLKIMGVN